MPCVWWRQVGDFRAVTIPALDETAGAPPFAGMAVSRDPLASIIEIGHHSRVRRNDGNRCPWSMVMSRA